MYTLDSDFFYSLNGTAAAPIGIFLLSRTDIEKIYSIEYQYLLNKTIIK